MLELFLFRKSIQCLLLFNITLKVLVMQGRKEKKRRERLGKREEGEGTKKNIENYTQIYHC